MAWNLAVLSSPLHPVSPPRARRLTRRLGEEAPNCCRSASRCRGGGGTMVAALPEGVSEGASRIDGGEDGFKLSSARSRLDLLDQLTSGSEDEGDGDFYGPSIREQLTELVDARVGDFSIPLGKKRKMSVNSLTISQRRNIKRQAYLDVVSGRNDYPLFAAIGAFVILPPIIILAVAILTGYVQLFP